MMVLIYFLIGFVGAVIAHTYDQANPIPDPPDISYLEQRLLLEERALIALCAFFVWPICVIVLLVYAALLLSRYSASSLLKLLGTHESNPRS